MQTEVIAQPGQLEAGEEHAEKQGHGEEARPGDGALLQHAAVEFMAFEAGCDEVFAVEVLPGIRWPAIIGFKQETVNGIYIVPPA